MLIERGESTWRVGFEWMSPGLGGRREVTSLVMRAQHRDPGLVIGALTIGARRLVCR